jgi:hypothetical protein
MLLELKLCVTTGGRILNGESKNSQFPKLSAEVWMKTGAPRVAAAGLKFTGIYPFNPHVMLEKAFASSSAPDRPTHCNVNRSQGTAQGCSNQEKSRTPEEVAGTCSISTDRSGRQILLSPRNDRTYNAPRRYLNMNDRLMAEHPFDRMSGKDNN